MRFCEHGDTGKAHTFTEMVEMNTDDLCPCRQCSGAKSLFDVCTLVQLPTLAEVSDQMDTCSGGMGHHTRLSNE